MNDNEREEIVYSGISTGETNIYEEIKNAIGVDIRNNPDYKIVSTGAEDNMGISETVYAPFQVIKKVRIITEPPHTPGGPGGGYPGGGGGQGGPGGGSDGPEKPGGGYPGGGGSQGGPGGGSDDPEIYIDEIEKAKKKYLNEDTENIMVKVIHKVVYTIIKWLAIAGISITLLSGFRKIIPNYDPATNSVSYTIVYDDDSCKEYTKEEILKVTSDLKIGGPVNLDDGDRLYFSSKLDKKEPIAIIGDLMKAGEYQISGVSVLVDGEIIDAYTDLFVQNPGVDLGKVVDDICNKHGLDKNNITVRIHIGNSSNKTRIGWIDATGMFNVDNLSQDIIDKESKNPINYSDTIENFEGSTITIQTENGPVTIKIKDDNGNLLDPGTKVLGSDGKEYEVMELSLTASQESKTGGKITWRIQNCNFIPAIAGLLSAAALKMLENKKNKEAEKNPFFHEFENEGDYIRFENKFKKAKEEKEKNSLWYRLKSILLKKEYDVLRKLTKEQAEEIYTAIITCHTADYSYSTDHKIDIKNGKIYAIYKDGSSQNITDVIMPRIHAIGKDNPVVAEGLLTDEVRETLETPEETKGPRK